MAGVAGGGSLSSSLLPLRQGRGVSIGNCVPQSRWMLFLDGIATPHSLPGPAFLSFPTLVHFLSSLYVPPLPGTLSSPKLSYSSQGREDRSEGRWGSSAQVCLQTRRLDKRKGHVASGGKLISTSYTPMAALLHMLRNQYVLSFILCCSSSMCHQNKGL